MQWRYNLSMAVSGKSRVLIQPLRPQASPALRKFRFMPHVHSDVAELVESHLWHTFKVKVVSIPNGCLRRLLAASSHQLIEQQIYHRWLKMLEVRIWFTVIFHAIDWVFKALQFSPAGSWAAQLVKHILGVMKGFTLSLQYV